MSEIDTLAKAGRNLEKSNPLQTDACIKYMQLAMSRAFDRGMTEFEIKTALNMGRVQARGTV